MDLIAEVKTIQGRDGPFTLRRNSCTVPAFFGFSIINDSRLVIGLVERNAIYNKKATYMCCDSVVPKHCRHGQQC